MKAKSFVSYGVAILFAAFVLSGINIYGQSKAESKYSKKDFCSNEHYSSNDQASFREKREFTVPATGSLTVDGGKNGGIKVEGSNRSDVLIRACVNAWAKTDGEAKSIAESVKIDTGSTIKAASSDDANWSVSYEILVPRNIGLKLTAHNGGISIKSVEGTVEFETNNGGVNLVDLAGDVRGRTTNGGVNVALTGNSWKGTGLDVTTTNGGVNLSVPDGYAANFETGTTNGGVKSDVAALTVETEDKDGWTKSKRIRASMNGGGAPVRVVTTNGGIKIGSMDK
ncbi:MAG TPA: DUF4097 family beta strand repeat-containing protein [Pyrinomonadaceae bacterium]|nr:DUF4097 family beta strand repeat-containing protein [Pyrinomonadaceae bacterium]